MDFSKVTRVHVVPGDWIPMREYWADEWMLSLEDDGKTLKLFGSGDGREHKAARNEALAKELGLRD